MMLHPKQEFGYIPEVRINLTLGNQDPIIDWLISINRSVPKDTYRKGEPEIIRKIHHVNTNRREVGISLLISDKIRPC